MLNRKLHKLPAICAGVLGLFLALAGAAETVGIRERVGTGGIRVNQLRQFVLTNQTVVTVDGVTLAGPPTSERIGTGGIRLRGQVTAGDATLEVGELLELHIENHTRGPVTQLDPLAVLGQLHTVTADTVLENLASAAELQIGSVVETSAAADVNGTAVATRIKSLSQGASRWKLVGRVNQFDPVQQTARIGEQQVSLVGVTPVGCAPLAVGATVDVRAEPVQGFVAGQTLPLAELRCLPVGTAGTPGVLAAIEGSIEFIDSTTQFRLAGLVVQHHATTQFRSGNAADLDAGVRLEVEGVYLDATTVTASKVRFVRPRIRIEAPALVGDVVPGTSLRLLDELFLDNPQARDEDGLFASGLSSSRQVEVRGYADSAGQLFATRARIRRNDPRPTEIVLAGPVQQLAQPNLQILGITVRTGPTTLFRDRLGQALTAEQFFAALAIGMMVEAEDATYNSATRELDPTVLQLGDDLLPADRGAGSEGVAAGTGDQIELDAVQIDGFE